MRKRTRIVPGLPGYMGRRLHYHYAPQNEEAEWQSTTTPIPAEPPRTSSRINDHVRSEGVDLPFRPVEHYQVSQQVLGNSVGPPDGNHLQGETLDQAWTQYPVGVGSSPYTYSGFGFEARPTVSIIQEAMPYVPEMARLTFDFRSELDTYLPEGYTEWDKVKWKKPKISLNTDFNIINFIFEWKETLRLASSWLTKKGLLKRYHAIAGYNQTLSGRAKAIADERLAHVYGTSLFLRDARKMFTLIVGWKHYADRFISQAGIVQRKYKLPQHHVITWTTPEVEFPVFGCEGSKLSIYNELTLDAHNTMYYTYAVPVVRGFLARLGQFCDSFGIQADLGILWDAATLTFVVDWFINVSEWLHANASWGDWTRIDVVLGPALKSGKVKWDRTLYWTRDGALNATDLHSPLLFQSVKYYERKQAKPPEFSRTDIKLEGSKGWRIGRIINASALGAQRLLTPAEETQLWFNYRASERKKARQFRTKFRLM